MRDKIFDSFGGEFLSFNSFSMTEHCHEALMELSENLVHHKNLRHGFMSISPSPEQIMAKLKDWHPRLIMSQVIDPYKTLAPMLMEVYQKAPASSAGVERHHKVGKRVHSSGRAGLGGGRVESQVGIAHNDRQLAQDAEDKRHPFEQFIALFVCI